MDVNARKGFLVILLALTSLVGVDVSQGHFLQRFGYVRFPPDTGERDERILSSVDGDGVFERGLWREAEVLSAERWSVAVGCLFLLEAAWLLHALLSRQTSVAGGGEPAPRVSRWRRPRPPLVFAGGRKRWILVLTASAGVVAVIVSLPGGTQIREKRPLVSSLLELFDERLPAFLPAALPRLPSLPRHPSSLVALTQLLKLPVINPPGFRSITKNALLPYLCLLMVINLPLLRRLRLRDVLRAAAGRRQGPLSPADMPQLLLHWPEDALLFAALVLGILVRLTKWGALPAEKMKALTEGRVTDARMWTELWRKNLSSSSGLLLEELSAATGRRQGLFPRVLYRDSDGDEAHEFLIWHDEGRGLEVVDLRRLTPLRGDNHHRIWGTAR